MFYIALSTHLWRRQSIVSFSDAFFISRHVKRRLLFAAFPLIIRRESSDAPQLVVRWRWRTRPAFERPSPHHRSVLRSIDPRTDVGHRVDPPVRLGQRPAPHRDNNDAHLAPSPRRASCVWPPSPLCAVRPASVGDTPEDPAIHRRLGFGCARRRRRRRRRER